MAAPASGDSFSDLDVLEQLFSSLHGQPLRLRTQSSTVSGSTLTHADQLLFWLAETDTTSPYTADCGFLSREENELPRPLTPRAAFALAKAIFVQHGRCVKF